MILFIVKCNAKIIQKQVRKGKYYSIESRSILTYLQVWLFLAFFDSLFLMILLQETNVPIFAAMLFITLVFVILTIFSIKEKIKFNNEKREILNNGIKIEGKVKREYVEETTSAPDIEHGAMKSIYMIIEYQYNNEIKNYITPQVEFRFDQLSDESVDVYVHNSKIFVTNFKITTY